MPSTFFGLEIGKRALAANQIALDVIGQNTANVNTPGYSRQVANFEPTDAYILQHNAPAQSLHLGTGLAVASVTRIRDEFIDRRILAAHSDQGALNNLKEILGRVEEAFNEPGNVGIGQLMTDFFNAFADLSANPESGAIRSTVRNRAETLAGAFRSVSSAIEQINPEIQSKIKVTVDEVNALTGQIADLNRQVRASIAVGDQPNGLLDKRGALLEKLSALADVQIIPMQNPESGKSSGDIQVIVGGYALVQGDLAGKLPTTPQATAASIGLVTDTGEAIPLRGGALYGLVRATTLLDGYQADLDALASGLINAVNTQHSIGYGLDGVSGRGFFTGADAASIAVSVSVESDLNAIAAAAPPLPPNTFAPGSGDNARALAALTAAPVINGFSLNEFYNAGVARIGADSRAYSTQADNQEKVVNLLRNQQSSVSGVSLDEELSRMLQYQRSYQAAARIINVMDDTLDRIINGLGVGR